MNSARSAASGNATRLHEAMESESVIFTEEDGNEHAGAAALFIASRIIFIFVCIGIVVTMKRRRRYRFQQRLVVRDEDPLSS